MMWSASSAQRYIIIKRDRQIDRQTNRQTVSQTNRQPLPDVGWWCWVQVLYKGNTNKLQTDSQSDKQTTSSICRVMMLSASSAQRYIIIKLIERQKEKLRQTDKQTNRQPVPDARRWCWVPVLHKGNETNLADRQSETQRCQTYRQSDRRLHKWN